MHNAKSHELIISYVYHYCDHMTSLHHHNYHNDDIIYVYCNIDVIVIQYSAYGAVSYYKMVTHSNPILLLSVILHVTIMCTKF